MSQIPLWLRFVGDIYSDLRDGVYISQQVKPEALWAVEISRAMTNNPKFALLVERCRGYELSSRAVALKLGQEIAARISLPEALAIDLEERRRAAASPVIPSPIRRAIGEKIKLDEAEWIKYSKLIPAPLLAKAVDLAIDRAASLQMAVSAATSAASSGQSYHEGRNLAEEEKIALIVDLAEKDEVELEQVATVVSLATRMFRGVMGLRGTPSPGEHVPGEERGDDLSRLSIGEMGRIATEGMLGFARRLSSGELSLKKQAKRGQGAPIVVLLDCSGSMGGEKDTHSKACFLTAHKVAEQQGRDLLVIHFNSSIQLIHEFEPGKTSQAALLKSLGMVCDYGTDFTIPFEKALGVIEAPKYQAGGGKAQILLITDGEESLEPGWIEDFLKEKNRLCLSTIQVGSGGNECVEEISDNYLVLETFDSQAAERLIASL